MLQISSLHLSAPVARPCPCFFFSELSGLMLPCACCPNRLLLQYIGEKHSPVLSHRWITGKRMLVDKPKINMYNVCVKCQIFWVCACICTLCLFLQPITFGCWIDIEWMHNVKGWPSHCVCYCVICIASQSAQQWCAIIFWETNVPWLLF